MTTSTATIADSIVRTPGILGGKPRIAGTRISVKHIAIWHLQMGRTVSDIAESFDLKKADIHAALAFFYANQAEIEQSIADENALVERLKKENSSLLTRLVHG